ncbi:hypothetical protein HMPREF0663_12488 [Hoylesella oralis ATCC 33269]|uniref:Uncharacterized protein n=1 Tax=Hoylesella oralis ATCC 33269 TaxID=873533 RepID=E7RT70_9BACT|nr:hypothetical protein HMPREF0663_12488 [Hoylesella oralis ATCC 33269]
MIFNRYKNTKKHWAQQKIRIKVSYFRTILLISQSNVIRLTIKLKLNIK